MYLLGSPQAQGRPPAVLVQESVGRILFLDGRGGVCGRAPAGDSLFGASTRPSAAREMVRAMEGPCAPTVVKGTRVGVEMGWSFAALAGPARGLRLGRGRGKRVCRCEECFRFAWPGSRSDKNRLLERLRDSLRCGGAAAGDSHDEIREALRGKEWMGGGQMEDVT